MPAENLQGRTGKKTGRLFGLPLSWGSQLTIATLGAVFFWWAQDKWLDGRIFPAARGPGERLWQMAPLLLCMGISFLCFVWVIALLIKLEMWKEAPKTEGAEGSAAPRRRGGLGWRVFTFLLFTAAVAVFYGGSVNLAYRYFPASAGTVAAVVGILSLAALFMLTPAIMRGGKKASREMNQPQAAYGAGTGRRGVPQWWIRFSAWLPTVVLLCVFFAPFKTIQMGWRMAALAGAILWPLGVHRLKMWIYRQSRKGNQDLALLMNRICAWLPGYGSSFEGVILFEAGRYGEARAFLQPLAFDSAGRPRLASVELYVYALALCNDGRAAEAQPLLEAAIEAAKPADALESALAACLLTQRKSPDRACALMEKAMATPQLRVSRSGQASDYAARIAKYAWALASAGRRDEAESRIGEAMALGSRLHDGERAGIEYFAGETWEALGHVENARAAYERAVSLRPSGVTALSSRKGLSRLARAEGAD